MKLFISIIALVVFLSAQGQNTKSTNATANEPTQSILRKGGWVKVSTTKTGIYKLSYQDLQDLGFSDPKAVRVFGNNDGQLPCMNNIRHLSDLQDIPLQIEDGGNGVLEKDDYVLFYAQSPHIWEYNKTDQMYTPRIHNYTDSNFFFITTSLGWGKQVQTLSQNLASNQTVSQYLDCYLTDVNDTNLVRSGQQWFRSLANPFSVTYACPNFIAGSEIKIQMAGAIRSSTNLSIALSGSGQTTLFSTNAWVQVEYGDVASDFVQKGKLTISQSPISLTATYPAFSTSSRAWIDYLVINAPSRLAMSTSQLVFSNPRENLAVAEYQIASSQNVKVWDVTIPHFPRAIETKFDGSTVSFIAARDSNRSFVAFKDDTFLKPLFSQRISNQNLHSELSTDLVIVANDSMRSYAKQIADYHAQHDGLQSLIVSQQQIFNEYSSGKPDPAALRNFFRNLYIQANDSSKRLKYVLLFGDGSYNNRDLNKFPNNIITYQSEESMKEGITYVSDDFYAVLDSTDGVSSGYIVGQMDIGVGRLAISSTNEAQAVVSKILRYRTDPRSRGNWQNTMTFLADDADQGWERSFTTESETCASNITSYNKNILFDKIYLDAFHQEASAGGNTYPEAAKALAERIAMGSLAVNFFGHANPIRLASENILSATNVLSWTNTYRMPLFITAGCQVGRYDDHNRKSLGEILLTHEKGGAIAILTTTRYVENTGNIALVSNICKFLFARNNGKALTLGDIVKHAKNLTGGSNQNNFSLLGDPALRIALPENEVITDSINRKPLSVNDTISALETITVTGHIHSGITNTLYSQFNGYVYPVLYDKKQNLRTLNNDNAGSMDFTAQNSVLFKGKATVKDGKFSFSFVLPKDIDLNYGKGMFSYFATDLTNDAGGNTDVNIGGLLDAMTSDTSGPKLSIYMNDTLFKSGGLTDQNPVLLVKIQDETGFNWSSSSIGHLATAVLDSNVTNGYILNDFFESQADNATTGYINYPLYNVTEGEHTIAVKLWDVYNNSSQAQTKFIVAKSAQLALTKVLAYPNPFTTNTSFSFEHNQQAQDIEVEILIYTASGELAKTFKTQYYANGFTDQNIAQWDGTNENGAPLNTGLYIYRLQIKNADGQVASKVDRVVMVK